jgi:hypothetical protein
MAKEISPLSGLVGRYAALHIIYYKSAMLCTVQALGMKIWGNVLSAVLLRFLIIIISRSGPRISRNCANEIARDPPRPPHSDIFHGDEFSRVFLCARVLCARSALRERGRELGVSAMALTINGVTQLTLSDV